jgi:hypothetical protein
MPLNRLTGLVGFYQLRQKITHGNAADKIHASAWMLNDLFITADRAFYETLNHVAGQHYPDRQSPAFVERSAASFVTQLEALIVERLPG